MTNKDNMEHNLSLPLHAVLSRIQDGIMQESYFGIPTRKSPLDAWIYQELLFESRPDVIIEIGNFKGGSALYLAHLCDSLGNGRVISIDISPHSNLSRLAVEHPRITFIEGDACDSFDLVKGMVQPSEKVLLIEDSAHTYENTLNVLRKYSVLLNRGDYFIVEDSICHHGLETGPYPGPYEAIDAFLAENKGFELDRSRERFFVTWNPKGYLRKI